MTLSHVIPQSSAPLPLLWQSDGAQNPVQEVNQGKAKQRKSKPNK
jgi:hypothetical protein